MNEVHRLAVRLDAEAQTREARRHLATHTHTQLTIDERLPSCEHKRGSKYNTITRQQRVGSQPHSHANVLLLERRGCVRCCANPQAVHKHTLLLRGSGEETLGSAGKAAPIYVVRLLLLRREWHHLGRTIEAASTAVLPGWECERIAIFAQPARYDCGPSTRAHSKGEAAVRGEHTVQTSPWAPHQTQVTNRLPCASRRAPSSTADCLRRRLDATLNSAWSRSGQSSTPVAGSSGRAMAFILASSTSRDTSRTACGGDGTAHVGAGPHACGYTEGGHIPA